MKLVTDVHYYNSSAIAAGVLFQNWDDRNSTEEHTQKILNVDQYEPGKFYKRELPCILALMENHRFKLDCIVIDGYVFLDGHTKPGLGKHLFDSLDGKVPIIGVAKNPFSGIDDKYKLYRGHSKNPLYVSTTGDLETAKENILSMYGDFRIPALLKRVDQLCRSVDPQC